MADKSYRIAVASTDGIVVNQHFGRADRFIIYRVDDGVVCPTGETIKVNPVCSGGDHNEESMLENINKISDCRYVLVSRIGQRAAMLTEQNGIIPMEIPGMIEESISKITAFDEIQDLFERN